MKASDACKIQAVNGLKRYHETRLRRSKEQRGAWLEEVRQIVADDDPNTP